MGAVPAVPVERDTLVKSARHNLCETAPISVGRNIASNSSMGIGGMLSGFLVQVLTARYFGASPDMDAFLVAFLLLSFMQSQLQSGGIVAMAFIPSFNRALREGVKEARAFFATTSVLTILLAFCFSLVCLLLATPIVHLLGAGLSSESMALAVRIFKMFSFLFLPLALGALFSAALRAEGHFFAVAFGPVVVNCCIVGSLVLLETCTGIMSYVWGWTLGFLCQLVLVLRPLVTWRALDLRLVSWKNHHLRVFAKTTSFLLLDVLSGLLLLAVERNMASALAPGTVSHINYAKLLYILPLRLVVSPVQLVMFSLFAQHFAAGRTDEMKRASVKTLSLLVFLMLPIALFIMCFSSDIVQLIYERGRFTPQDTQATAGLLTFYALSIPALALWWQLRMVSFALGNVTFPFVTGLLVLVLFYIGSHSLIEPLGASSLALNWAVSYYSASIVLGVGLAYRYDIPFWSSFVKPLWRLSPAVLATFGCISALHWFSFIPRGPDDASWEVAVRIVTYGTVVLGTYMAVAWAVGVEEVRTVSVMIGRRLKRF